MTLTHLSHPLPTPVATGRALIDGINNCTVPPGRCAFWWLGQHSFILKLGDAVVYLDPYLTPDKARRVPPLLRPAEVTNADAVFGSHDHGDHIDRPAWPALADASPGAIFFVPVLLRRRLIEELGIAPDRIVGVDHQNPVRFGGIEVFGVPAAHELLDVDPATGLYPCMGYVIRGNGMTVYHAGDTCIYEGMHAILRKWHFDLMFLPINGRDARRFAANCIGNMTYQEAVDLAGALRPGMVIPAHFEMFEMNSEAPHLFVDYLQIKYPGLDTMIPVHGRRTVVPAKA